MRSLQTAPRNTALFSLKSHLIKVSVNVSTMIWAFPSFCNLLLYLGCCIERPPVSVSGTAHMHSLASMLPVGNDRGWLCYAGKNYSNWLLVVFRTLAKTCVFHITQYFYLTFLLQCRFKTSYLKIAWQISKGLIWCKSKSRGFLLELFFLLMFSRKCVYPL